jgi:hypothetical protein
MFEKVMYRALQNGEACFYHGRIYTGGGHGKDGC